MMIAAEEWRAGPGQVPAVPDPPQELPPNVPPEAPPATPIDLPPARDPREPQE